MKCIVLCAGYNNNLKPRSLLRIDDKFTALDVLIEQIQSINEIDQIYVVTNGKYYDCFCQWYLEHRYDGVKVINDNTTSLNAKLGAIGDIKFTINCENINDDILIVAGDAIYDFDFNGIFDYFKSRKAPVVAVQKVDNLVGSNKYGIVKFDENHKITEMHEKVVNQNSDYISLAMYFYPKEIIRQFDYYLAEGNKLMSPGYFLEYLYKNTDVFAYEILGHYYSLK